MPTLTDNRKYQSMTVADADALFARIAQQEAILKREAATADKKHAEITLALQDVCAPILSERDALVDELRAYIAANPGRFVKPRKHKVGEMGTYGIETDPAKTIVDDPDLVRRYADEYGLDDLYSAEIKINKKAVESAASGGHTIPGVRIVPAGDVIKYKVSAGYLDTMLNK